MCLKYRPFVMQFMNRILQNCIRNFNGMYKSLQTAIVYILPLRLVTPAAGRGQLQNFCACPLNFWCILKKMVWNDRRKNRFAATMDQKSFLFVWIWIAVFREPFPSIWLSHGHHRWNHSLVSPILLYFCTCNLIGLFLRISKKIKLIGIITSISTK